VAARAGRDRFPGPRQQTEGVFGGRRSVIADDDRLLRAPCGIGFHQSELFPYNAPVTLRKASALLALRRLLMGAIGGLAPSCIRFQAAVSMNVPRRITEKRRG
jgi:hypothetical protein